MHYVYARVAGFSNKVTRHHERLRVAFDLQNADFEFNYLTSPVSYAGSYQDVSFAPEPKDYCHLKNLIVIHYGYVLHCLGMSRCLFD